MGVVLTRQRHVNGVGSLALVGFLVALMAALIDTIWAVYIYSFIPNESMVGFISGALTALSFLCFFAFVPLIEKTSKSGMYTLSLVLTAILYLLFAINRQFYVFLALAFVLTCVVSLRITNFGIIIRDLSVKKKLTQNEGLIYTFMNLGWLVGPLIAGLVADRYDINLVFVLAAVFCIFALLSFHIFKIEDNNHAKKVDGNVFRNFSNFFTDRKRVVSYILSGAISFWWTLVYIFMPLYIIKSGLRDAWIGYFLFACVIPLILFEYTFSKKVAKVGFRKMFRTGFLLVAVISFSAFFVTNVYAVLGLIALASFGMAMLEPTVEAYFFDITNKRDELRFYGPYNTGLNTGQFIAKILSALILLALPFRYVFLLYGGYMLLMFLLSRYTKGTISGEAELGMYDEKVEG